MPHWKPFPHPDGRLRLVRRRLFRETLVVRENYLEYRVALGRWCRVTRITEGWLYLEQVEVRSNWQCCRLRVRGQGGHRVLVESQRLDWDDNAVPAVLAQLAESLAQETGWPLDVPYRLRRGARIRTS